MPITLTKVPLQETYVLWFEKSDGTTIEVETTKADYEYLGTKNPTNPIHPDGKFTGGGAVYRPKLNEYMDDGKQKIVNIDGTPVLINERFMVGDSITNEGITEVARVENEIKLWL